MSDVVVVLVFVCVLAAGFAVMRGIDSFISRHMIKYDDQTDEEEDREQSENNGGR